MVLGNIFKCTEVLRHIEGRTQYTTEPRRVVSIRKTHEIIRDESRLGIAVVVRQEKKGK